MAYDYRMMIFRWLVLLCLSAFPAVLSAQGDGEDRVRQTLAPTGTLRAAFIAGNPVQASVDPDTGEVTGPAAEMTRELGRRIGVPVLIQPVTGAQGVMNAVIERVADIGFLAYDMTRAERVAYAQAYMIGHNGYIVRADSPIRSPPDADQVGTRIGAREGIAVDLHLSRTLQRAEQVHLPRSVSDEGAVHLLLQGELDAYAANKQRLAVVTADEPRIRVVDGSVMPVEQAIVVHLQNDMGVAHLNAFIGDVRTSGLLGELVEGSGLAGVEVAPPIMR